MARQGNRSSSRTGVRRRTQNCGTSCCGAASCATVQREEAIGRGDSVNQLRCAIYARFSSDRQSAVSITDQVRKCREHAHGQGWTVLDEHVYADEAVSATSSARTGLQKLLASAE